MVLIGLRADIDWFIGSNYVLIALQLSVSQRLTPRFRLGHLWASILIVYTCDRHHFKVTLWGAHHALLLLYWILGAIELVTVTCDWWAMSMILSIWTMLFLLASHACFSRLIDHWNILVEVDFISMALVHRTHLSVLIWVNLTVLLLHFRYLEAMLAMVNCCIVFRLP